MADNTKIEWTNATWNPVRARNKETGGVGHFCEKISPGCANCYSARMQKRFRNKIRFNEADRDKVELFLDERVLTQPLRWRTPKMVFPCSMTDLFADFVPDEWLDRIFAVMAIAYQHTFQILTKRPERMKAYVSTKRRELSVASYGGEFGVKDFHNSIEWPLPNVWLGTSVENQEQADKRIPELLDTPAAVRWLSCEPLLGAIDLRALRGEWHMKYRATMTQFDALLNNPFGAEGEGGKVGGISWVVVGGESGNGSRPMHPQWARGLRDQCVAAGVPFFFKQWGSFEPVTPLYDGRDDDAENERGELEQVDRRGHIWTENDGQPNDPQTWLMEQVGKKAAGRLLDGREWNEFPSGTSK